MSADRIAALRTALEHIKDMVEGNDALGPLYVVADSALSADEKARLCAPAEEQVAARTNALCPNPKHGDHCCGRTGTP